MTDVPTLFAGAAADLLVGGRKLVFMPNSETILMFNVEGQLYALENSHPHTAASLATSSCVDHVIPPVHGLKFDIRNGWCTASQR
ncbi:Rieske (2Fe-2S) protein [Comamonas resistens]|uniref:Rieske (2Fe-2S) protein n=1 Tax=Comamonas resistens TaxID=3046670 RepID=UPI0039BC901D